MEIRKMTINDYENVYALWLASAGMGLNNLDDSKKGMEAFLKRNPETCFVAMEHSELVGVILVGSDGRRGYIYHTAVHPNHRRKGIATKLVEKAIAALEACGINKVALVVFEKNTDGNAFWEQAGFTVRNDLVYRNRTITEMIRIDT